MNMAPQLASAAVAALKCLGPEECFLLLRRATRQGDPWSGHFSFPGGRKEAQDQDLLATCIRETAEETGINLNSRQLQQTLPPQQAGRLLSRPILVQPFLFTLPEPPPLQLNPEEIQGYHWLSIDRFRDPDSHVIVEMIPGQLFPAFPVLDYYLWGFTYRLMRAILNLDGEN